MSISPALDPTTFRKTLETAGSRKVALIYHLKVSDAAGYEAWRQASRGQFCGKQLFRVQVDPVAREGMLIDEIVIHQFPAGPAAGEFVTAFHADLQQVADVPAVLAIVPEPALTFGVVKVISWLVRLFKKVTDRGVPPARWQAENSRVWPDAAQMAVARGRDLDKELFVYNLNKYRSVARYRVSAHQTKEISGRQAYERYSKIAGFELLRRGAYPVYGGTPFAVLVANHECMLADQWHHFIFVRYPQRRNLLATIESPEFHLGEVHRDAGLDRVAIFMAARR